MSHLDHAWTITRMQLQAHNDDEDAASHALFRLDARWWTRLRDMKRWAAATFERGTAALHLRPHH